MTTLFFIGITLILVNLFRLLYNLLYGEVVIYNLREEGRYRRLGSGWPEYRKGTFVLTIPEKFLDASRTTAYRLETGLLFAACHEGELLRIRFGSRYETVVPISRRMIAKNHVATSGKL